LTKLTVYILFLSKISEYTKNCVKLHSTNLCLSSSTTEI